MVFHKFVQAGDGGVFKVRTRLLGVPQFTANFVPLEIQLLRRL